MIENRTIRVVVFEAKQYSEGWPSKNVLRWREWLLSVLETIPAQYRDKAEIEIDIEDGDDWHHPMITISYCRPETQEETDQRIYSRVEKICKEERRLMQLLQALRLTRIRLMKEGSIT